MSIDSSAGIILFPVLYDMVFFDMKYQPQVLNCIFIHSNTSQIMVNRVQIEGAH